MDNAVTDEERADLKAAALRGLHAMKEQFERSRADLSSGKEVLVSPEESDRYNAYLNELRHAGVDIPHWCYRRPPIMPPTSATPRHEARVSGSDLLANITAVLALVEAGQDA